MELAVSSVNGLNKIGRKISWWGEDMQWILLYLFYRKCFFISENSDSYQSDQTLIKLFLRFPQIQSTKLHEIIKTKKLSSKSTFTHLHLQKTRVTATICDERKALNHDAWLWYFVGKWSIEMPVYGLGKSQSHFGYRRTRIGSQNTAKIRRRKGIRVRRLFSLIQSIQHFETNRLWKI